MIGVGIIQLISLPLIIFIGGVVLPLLLVCACLLLLILGSPILVMGFVCAMTTCSLCLKVFFLGVTLVLYPLISAIIVILVIIFFLLYPFTRSNFNFHHGLFDIIELFVLEYVCKNLQILVWIIDIWWYFVLFIRNLLNILLVITLLLKWTSYLSQYYENYKMSCT